MIVCWADCLLLVDCLVVARNMVSKLYGLDGFGNRCVLWLLHCAGGGGETKLWCWWLCIMEVDGI